PSGSARWRGGESAAGFFWTVPSGLAASWSVAVLSPPYPGLKLRPDFARPGGHADADAIYDTRVYRALRRVIAFALRHRIAVAAATVLMFVASLAAFPFVQQQFFPTSTRTELFFELRLPEGTAIGATDAAAKQAENLVTG